MFEDVYLLKHILLDPGIFISYGSLRKDRRLLIASILSTVIKLYLNGIRKYQNQPLEFQIFGTRSFQKLIDKGISS